MPYTYYECKEINLGLCSHKGTVTRSTVQGTKLQRNCNVIASRSFEKFYVTLIELRTKASHF